MQTGSGDHLRYVPGELARALVTAGSAIIANQNGKVKSIRLLEAASSSAERIGPPSGACLFGTKFTRKVRGDDHAVTWWEHHPRSTY